MVDLADANLAIDSACDFNGVAPIGRNSGINRFYYHPMPMISESEAGRQPSLISSATAIDGTSFGLTRRDCIDVFRQLINGMMFCPEVDSMSMGELVSPNTDTEVSLRQLGALLLTVLTAFVTWNLCNTGSTCPTASKAHMKFSLISWERQSLLQYKDGQGVS